MIGRRVMLSGLVGGLITAACGGVVAPTTTPAPPSAPVDPTRPAGAAASSEPTRSVEATKPAAVVTPSGAVLSTPTAAGTPVAGWRLQVVTTVAPITNIVRNVAGERVVLSGIVPEGSDSHTFEPTPSDIKLLAAADLVILNGLNLEVPTERLAEANKKAGRELLKLGDSTITRAEWVFDFSFPEAEGDPNPHLWMNVAHSMRYAELVREALSRLDAANRETYARQASAYLGLLDRLDKAVAATIKTIPEANRKLLTYHDSWPYFAKRYGMTVIGAIQPADFKEPSAREVAGIIDQIRREKVPAIFSSEVFPSKVLEQIGKETGVKYIDTLRDDDLPGGKDAPEHTYVGMILENVRTMAEALGGNAEPLKGIEPRNLA